MNYPVIIFEKVLLIYGRPGRGYLTGIVDTNVSDQNIFSAQLGMLLGTKSNTELCQCIKMMHMNMFK
jgi:hypothetical protein